jgi:hypothetical protein
MGQKLAARGVACQRIASRRAGARGARICGCRAGPSGAGGLARQSAAMRRAAAGEEWSIRRAELAAALAAVPRSGGEGPAALSDSGGGSSGFDSIGGYSEVPTPPGPRGRERGAPTRARARVAGAGEGGAAAGGGVAPGA